MKILISIIFILQISLSLATSQSYSSKTAPNGLSQNQWQSVIDLIKSDYNNHLFGSGLGLSQELQQQAYVKASNTDSGDKFAYRVAISGDIMAVSAFNEDSNATGVDGDENNDDYISSGAVYVFARTDGVWLQEAYLKASNTGSGDGFGISLAISSSGETIVVGAPDEDSNATGIDGDGSNNAANESGAVYVFKRSFGAWSQQAYLKASNTGVDDQFGIDVGISENTIIVGAKYEDNLATDAGAAYVFRFYRVEGVLSWNQQAILRASNAGNNDYFGGSVAISNSIIVVSATGEGSSATGIDGVETNNTETSSGAAYIFEKDMGSWSQTAYVKASNTQADDHFGSSVAIDDKTIVIGATGEDSNSVIIDGNENSNAAASSGAVYVFKYALLGGSWIQQAYIKAHNTGIGDGFGFSVAISSDTLVVGATGEDSSSTTINNGQADNSSSSSGAAYVYSRDVTEWSLSNYLKSSNSEEDDSFGTSVAVSSNTVVIGSKFEDSNDMGINGAGESDNSSINSGAAYVFSPPQYDIQGTVINLTMFSSLTISFNGEESVIVNGSGVFSFNNNDDGMAYEISVAIQPINRFCTVSGGGNGDGTGIINGENITNIIVNCSDVIFNNGFEEEAVDP